MDLIDNKRELLQLDGETVYIIGIGCTGYYKVDTNMEILSKEAPVNPDETVVYTFDLALNKQSKMQVFRHK